MFIGTSLQSQISSIYSILIGQLRKQNTWFWLANNRMSILEPTPLEQIPPQSRDVIGEYLFIMLHSDWWVILNESESVTKCARDHCGVTTWPYHATPPSSGTHLGLLVLFDPIGLDLQWPLLVELTPVWPKLTSALPKLTLFDLRLNHPFNNVYFLIITVQLASLIISN